LVEIAKTACDKVFHVEGASDLPNAEEYLCKRIGVTAGASTPDWIIKEVLHTMEENTKVTQNINEEENWAAALDNALVTLHTGEKVKGTVVAIHPTEVIVNLNYKSDGIIPASELTDDPTLTPEDVVKVGEEIDVFVIRVNDVEGTVLLSKKKLDNEKKYAVLEEAMENGTILSGIVIEAVKGGVIVLCEGIKVFVPGSQANDRYLSDLSVLVDATKQVPVKIIKFDRRSKKILGSIKQVLLAEKAKKAEAFWADATVGKEYKGVVKTLTDFGAFVDIGGVEGLVHVSQLSWAKIKHPSEVIKVGDEITVRILKIDTDENGKSKVSLGYKKDEENPWVIAKSKFEVGNVVNVTITNVTAFGAFAELIPGVEGLIHISQIANKRIAKPSDELSKGQKVDAKIIDINWDATPTPKIALSIRALLPEEEIAVEAPVAEEANDEPTEYKEENTATMAENMPEIATEE
ncbi:MAG: S1 RNA-binding domain-containing protein, partial [Clostridia bacterium]|nr:S1 RNA-binding domain-containing protein [Clostridia bacterium]